MVVGAGGGDPHASDISNHSQLISSCTGGGDHPDAEDVGRDIASL